MKYTEPLYIGSFVERPHRFGAYVSFPEGVRYVHVPASGRMAELLVPGARCGVLGDGKPGQKTQGRLVLVEHGGQWVSVDSQLPNLLVGHALSAGRLPGFEAYGRVRPESRYGASRFDFLLEDEAAGTLPPCLLEVKSVTLVVGEQARFPDAPTLRGQRHLVELIAAVGEGYRAAVVFVIQRSDAVTFSPNFDTDPGFADALRQASTAGVEIYAYTCQVGLFGVELAAPVPVEL